MHSQENLLAKFPRIFPKPFGLEHAEGWLPLLDSTCSFVQTHIDLSRQRRADALKRYRLVRWAQKHGDTLPLRRFLCGSQPDSKVAEILAKRQMDVSSSLDSVPLACPQVVALQVKEKFGTLRFYYTGGDEFTQQVISLAEHISGQLCELCGAPGKLGGTGWLTTRCDSCRGLSQRKSA